LGSCAAPAIVLACLADLLGIAFLLEHESGLIHQGLGLNPKHFIPEALYGCTSLTLLLGILYHENWEQGYSTAPMVENFFPLRMLASNMSPPFAGMADLLHWLLP
jgi:hypothetical protein